MKVVALGIVDGMLPDDVKDWVRAERMLLQLKLKGLSDEDILAWWEEANISDQGTPRSLWNADRFDEVERAAEAIEPGPYTQR